LKKSIYQSSEKIFKKLYKIKQHLPHNSASTLAHLFHQGITLFHVFCSHNQYAYIQMRHHHCSSRIFGIRYRYENALKFISQPQSGQNSGFLSNELSIPART